MAETTSSSSVTVRATSGRAAMQPLERRSSRLSKQDEIEDVDEEGKENGGGGGDGSSPAHVSVNTTADSSKKMAHTSIETEVAVCVVNGDGDVGHAQDDVTTVARTADCGPTAAATISSQDTAHLDNADVRPGDGEDVSDTGSCSTLVGESDCRRVTERAVFLGSSSHVVIVSQDSVDSDNSSPTQAGGRQKSLVRCQAVCDDNCSLGDADSGNVSGDGAPTHVIRSSSLLTPGGSSSLGSSTDRDVSPELSRDVSLDRQYTDNKGVDLEAFFKATLNKSHSDRMMLLKLEQEMLTFIRDDSASERKFGPMQKSYDRMLVHRVAAFFGLDHNVDSTGKVVVVTKGPNVRVPEFKFTENFGECAPSEEDQPKKLLRRDPECRSFDETRNRLTLDGKKSRSFEERSMAYEQARARLFNQPDESQSSKTYYTSHLNPHNTGQGKSSTSQWVKVGGGGRRQWSSTESGYSTDGGRRGNVSKAGSLTGGVTLLSRNDSHGSGSVLCKTDSTCSGTVSSVCSPMRPPPIPSSPPLDCHLSESGSSRSGASPAQFAAQGQDVNSIPVLPFSVDEGGDSMAVWVASGLDVIPDGSVIINPDTGKPHLNADGSIFRWRSTLVCKNDPNTVDTEQPSISPPANMAANVKPVDMLQYTVPAGQLAYDASEQSSCVVMSADEQQPMVMMAPQMQPMPGVQVAGGYMPIQQQQAMSAGAAAANTYSSYPLFNFSNMTIQSVEMYPAYAPQQQQQVHMQQAYATAAPQAAVMPEGAIVQQQQPYVHYHHHHGGAAAYASYPYAAPQPTAVMGGGGNMYVAAPQAAYLVPTAVQLPPAPIQQQNGPSPASAIARQVAYVGQAVVEGGRQQQPGVVSVRNPPSLAHVVVGQPMAPSPASVSASGGANMYPMVSQQQSGHMVSAGPPSHYHGVAVQQQQASQPDVYANSHQHHYQYAQQQAPAQRPMTLVAPVRQQAWTEGNAGTTRFNRDSTPLSNTNTAALRLVSPPAVTQQQASVSPRRRSTRVADKTSSSQE